jgi:hypothetical protein
MKYLVLALLALTACSDPPKPSKHVAMKYCIEKCMSSQFGNFHGGKMFGGSSSMNGLTQTQIFDRVEKYCNDFYKDEQCCHGSWVDESDNDYNQVHDNYYGACDK